MTINEAFQELLQSAEFKDIAKKQNSEGNKYRVYIGRFNRNELKAGAMVELLMAHGYEIKANKATKKKK